MNNLKRAVLQQILSYANAREQEGWYYGNKEQFEARHAVIVRWVNEQLDAELKLPRLEVSEPSQDAALGK